MEISLHALRDQIVMPIDGGATLRVVDEELIEPAPVGEDEVWSHTKRRQRSPMALEVVA